MDAADPRSELDTGYESQWLGKPNTHDKTVS